MRQAKRLPGEPRRAQTAESRRCRASPSPGVSSTAAPGARDTSSPAPPPPHHPPSSGRPHADGLENAISCRSRVPALLFARLVRDRPRMEGAAGATRPGLAAPLPAWRPAAQPAPPPVAGSRGATPAHRHHHCQGLTPAQRAAQSHVRAV